MLGLPLVATSFEFGTTLFSLRPLETRCTTPGQMNQLQSMMTVSIQRAERCEEANQLRAKSSELIRELVSDHINLKLGEITRTDVIL